MTATDDGLNKASATGDPNQQSRSSTTGGDAVKSDSFTTVMPVAAPADDAEINFRELYDIVWSGKWVVLAVALGCALLGVAYALISKPVYQADGLVQVEEEKNSISASMGELSSLLGGAPTQAPAEIALLKSRMVLGAVADKLKLDVIAEPDYLPLLGEPIARRREGLLALALPMGLNRFAWGGETIRVTTLEMPQSWYGEPLTLVAGAQGYQVLDENDRVLLAGKVGERASAQVSGGTLSLFVQELVARPGTHFQLTRRAMQAVLEDMAEQVTVAEQPRDSGVLSLKVQAQDAMFASLLVNEIQDAYVRQNVERRSAQAEQSLEFLKQQLPDLKAKVDEAQAKLNSYQLQKGTVDVQRETDLVLRQSVDLETQRLQLIQERDAALQRFTAQHPVVITLNEQVRGLEREQEMIRKRVETLPEKQQEILSLMRDVEVNQQLYTALLNSAQELQVTKAGTIGNVRIVDSGMPPLDPIKPRVPLVIALSVIMGVTLGVACLFVMRALLRGVDRPEEIERQLGLSTYASIPYSQHQRRLSRKRGSKSADGTDVLAALDKEDLAIEALRSLRTSLHFAMMEAQNNIVMFTGPIPALGKSFITINFGAVLALSGKRVIVIDADLRRGRLHKHVAAARSPGVSDYVADTADLLKIVHASSISGLDFIATGTYPPNPAEILMSERFGELLKTLSKSYDYVLIDTPPTLPVTDAAIIGGMAGTTLVVLKSAEHPMRAIEETVRRLRQGGAHVRGVIFNQVGARVGSRGYGAYGAAYGYSSRSYTAKQDS